MENDPALLVASRSKGKEDGCFFWDHETAREESEFSGERELERLPFGGA
jgi:hypothetical protein